MPKLKTGAIDQLIGKRLRKERKRQGLTLDAIARAVGVTPAQVQNYELGTAALTISRLVAISKVLGRKTRFFLEGKE
jgi:transcriptional regulator with XRE-family HTH domain